MTLVQPARRLSRFVRFLVPLAVVAAGLPAVASAASASTASTSASPVPAAPAFHVSPKGFGAKDGSSWGNAAPLTALPTLVARTPAGKEIWLAGDAGTYHVSTPIRLTAGGADGQPVTLRSMLRGSSAPGAHALFKGQRTAPYSPTGRPGRPLFVLAAGASNLRFVGVDCRNVGNGCFVLAANARNIEISGSRATNVRRFVENLAGVKGTSASVVGLTVRNVTVHGFSKGAIRLAYATRQVLVEDVVGDSQGQDKDNFAMGVHLRGTVSDVVLRRVVMNNAVDTTHDYWNGDGFTAEKDVRRLTFEDTSASGNTDAGYDIKASDVRFTRAYAADNKRNFRLSGTATMTECTALHPRKRGGTGDQQQVQLRPGAKVLMERCTVSDDAPGTTVFDIDGGAVLQLVDTTVTRHDGARLARLTDGGTLLGSTG